MRETRQTTAIGRPRTFLNIVLDASSSMGEIRDATIRLYNEFIQSQQRERADELFVTLTTFNDANKIRTVYAAKPVQEVQPLTAGSYVPEGMTALYDGVARSVLDMEAALGEKARVLTVIITDGDENDSEKYRTAAAIREFIATRQQRGNWTFVLMAAGVDLDRTAQGMGIARGNANDFSATASGIQTGMAKVDRAVRTYRQGDDMSTADFYAGAAKKWTRPTWASSPKVTLTDDD